MSLELKAMRWLRFKKSCPLAFFERGPRNPHGRRPDVIGITPARYMIEVEIKRSVADFRADFKKRHIVFRDDLADRWPKWFYYLLAPEIADRCEVPEWAGKLTVDDYYVRVLKPAPQNSASSRLSVKDTCRLIRVLGNQILSTEEKVSNWFQRFREPVEQWGVEYQI